VQALGLGQVLGDRGGARVVEDPAAHRDQVHELVAELGVVGRDVAAEREVAAAERLREAADHHRGALREDRPVERPRRRDRGVDDEPRPRAPRGDRGGERGDVLRAHERVGERLGEHEPGLGPDGRGHRGGVAVVDDRHRRAEPAAAPLEERPRLVVDLPQGDRVRAPLEQRVGDERERLHAAVGDERCARALEPAQRRDQGRRAGRAVARVEVRQLGPRAVSGEQERRLGLLPRDDGRRAEQVALDRALLGVQPRHAAALRAPIERRVQLAGRRAHGRERRALGRAARGIEPGRDPRRHAIHSTTPSHSVCSTRPSPWSCAISSRIVASSLSEMMKPWCVISGSPRLARFWTVKPARRTRLSIRRGRPVCGSAVTRR
jgi:hypothetical protein